MNKQYWDWEAYGHHVYCIKHGAALAKACRPAGEKRKSFPALKPLDDEFLKTLNNKGEK